jgi:hypothetical protein
MEDLKQAFPSGMKYPYIDVANAILSISTPEPIARAPFIVVWSNEHTCDGYDADSLEEAQGFAIDTLIEWQAEESSNWSFLPDGTPTPTDEQVESWDYMIYNCYVYVKQYNPNTDEYETVWEPSDEELEEIGWHEWNTETEEKK